MKKIIFALLLLLCCSQSFAVVNPVYDILKEMRENRINQLEQQIIELNQLLNLLIQMNAPQYLIDQVQSRIDELTDELNYLLNIEFLE